MNKYLEIGSIVLIDKIEMMVVGYNINLEEESVIDGYLVVKYPIGFQGKNSVAFLPIKSDFAIVFEVISNQETREYLDAQKRFADTLISLGKENAEKQLKAIDSIFAERTVL